MNVLRDLPKIDKFVTLPAFFGLSNTLLTRIAKDQIEALRIRILSNKTTQIDHESLIQEVLDSYHTLLAPSLKPLINATGVILHTNMGRSLIDPEILDRASRVLCNYSNLEYNQSKGCRGERYEHVSKHLRALLGVEDVLVVNNNASAVFLVLNTFAKGKEVVVSRGELVEIGGSFRIPEVMSQSGAILHEVGATNKTKASDYANAINENTAILMKVHRSNFTIEGFSSETEYADIKTLSKEHKLIDYYDLGSGYIPTLPYNLSNDEHPISKVLEDEPNLISFSGDKLFGSVQAGIIAGKKGLIDELKKNQLLRMLRVDKITLSILEETIKAYLEERYDLIPTLKLLFTDTDELQDRAEMMRKEIGSEISDVIKTSTVMGGGTLPNKEFPTIALHIHGKATKLERYFRARDIIGRIERDMFLIDLRALESKYDQQIITAAKEFLS
ncbi:MAG: L-seryl-tRNA(Sec) selenium transferase [Sulfurovum sp.]|nr:L-seryl-tRNA(Sec) selenium transferase [Sulfurovum sp.]